MLPALLDNWCNPATSPSDECIAGILAIIPSSVTITDLLRFHLGPYLTNEDGKVRSRATGLLATLLARAGMSVLMNGTPFNGNPSEDSKSVAAALLEFLCGRVADYPSISPACDGLMELLGPLNVFLADSAAETTSSKIFAGLNVPSLDHASRHKVLLVLLTIIRSERWVAAIGEPGSKAFAAGVVLAVDSEKDPRCLVLVLELVQRTLRHYAMYLQSVDGGTVVLEELFDVAACYFPISFTPPPGNPHAITREMLVDGLQSVFTSTYRIAYLVMPLLFEKLSSTIVSAKLDSIRCLSACAQAYGITVMLPFLREACDALRSEVIHPVDAIVTQESLACVSTLATLVSTALDPSLTVSSQSLPGWRELEVGLLQPSSDDVLRSPDSLLGRAGVSVIVALARSSGYAYVTCLKHTMRLLAAVFDPTKKTEHRTGAVAVFEHVTACIPNNTFSLNGAATVIDAFREIADTLSSVVVSPGDSDGAQCSAIGGLVNIAVGLPSTIPTPAPHLFSHLCDLLVNAKNNTVVRTCSDSLVKLSSHLSTCASVVTEVIPFILTQLSSATQVGNSVIASRLFAALKPLCDNGDVFVAAVPKLIELALATKGDGVVVNFELFSEVISILSTCSVVKTQSSATDAVILSVFTASFQSLTSDSANVDVSPLIPTIIQTASMYCSVPVQSGVREIVSSVFLSQSSGEFSVSTGALAVLPPTLVTAMSQLSGKLSPEAIVPWVNASMCTTTKGAAIPNVDAMLRLLWNVVIEGSAPCEPACICIGSIMNRIAKASGSDSIIQSVLEQLSAVIGTATVAVDRQLRALQGLLCAVKGLTIAGCTLPCVPSTLSQLCELAASTGSVLSLEAGSGLASLFSAHNDGPLSKSNGATISAVYQQRLYSLLYGKLVDGRLPGELSPGVLQGVCGMITSVSRAIISDKIDKLLPIVLVALSNDNEIVRVSAVGALQFFTQEAVQLVTPHLSTVVPRLVQIACTAGRAIVRAEALDCLKSFTTLPFHQLNPLRPAVVRGLVPALDDPKRGVRRRAVACRNEWITLSTTPV